MKRAFTGPPPQDTEDVAKAYNTLDDGTPTDIPLVKAGEGVFGGSSGGMFTCVEDLLKAYGAMVAAINHEFGSGQSPLADAPSPFKCARDVFSAKVPLGQPTLLKSSYGFGTARTQLPGVMGQIGMNPGLMPEGKMPVVAKGTPSRLCPASLG
jgi:hypothetical protein